MKRLVIWPILIFPFEFKSITVLIDIKFELLLEISLLRYDTRSLFFLYLYLDIFFIDPMDTIITLRTFDFRKWMFVILMPWWVYLLTNELYEFEIVLIKVIFGKSVHMLYIFYLYYSIKALQSNITITSASSIGGSWTACPSPVGNIRSLSILLHTPSPCKICPHS